VGWISRSQPDHCWWPHDSEIFEFWISCFMIEKFLIINVTNINEKVALSIKNQAFKIDQKQLLISAQLLHVDTIGECFIFNLLLQLLTVCGERGDHFSWRSLVYNNSHWRSIGRNLLNKFLSSHILTINRVINLPTVQLLETSFLPRCMQCRRSLAMRILSVCPSHAWIVTKR